MSFLNILSQLLSTPPISILLQTLVNQYLSDSYCLTLVLDKPIDFNVNISFTCVIPDNSAVDSLTKQLLEVSEKGCSDYIVYMSDPQKFMAALDQASHRGNARRSGRKIIFLPFTSDASYVNKSLELFSMKESTFVANMLLVLSKIQMKLNCEVYDLVTHEFISLFHDKPLYLDQWDSCTQNFDKNVDLFPHDMTNLNGRVVRVACFTYKPYSLLDLDTALVASQRDGMEIRIVDEFCRRVNCTIEIVDEVKDQWGEIYENGTGIGILGDVAIDRADMGISALYSWFEEYKYLDFSAAAIRSGVTCIAPSPKILASWEMPLMPFSWYMWYAVGISFIFASVGLMVANSSTDRAFLTIFGIMLSQAATLFQFFLRIFIRVSLIRGPLVAARVHGSHFLSTKLYSQSKEVKSWRTRRITGWILGASVIIISAYGAGLASTFTVPKYERSIDTMQDLVDRKMEWGATHDAWIFSLELSTEPLVKQLVSQFKIYSAVELEQKSFTRNMAFSIEKLPAGYFAIGDYITKEALMDLTLMSDNFYYEQCVVMMRKSSVYTDKMSELIGRLHESGLLLAWETQVALKYLNFEVQQAVMLSRSKTDAGTFTSLRLRHVVGVYILYALGVGLSTLVFLGEYYVGNAARRS